jgi:hypothetical protein
MKNKKQFMLAKDTNNDRKLRSTHNEAEIEIMRNLIEYSERKKISIEKAYNKLWLDMLCYNVALTSQSDEMVLLISKTLAKGSFHYILRLSNATLAKKVNLVTEIIENSIKHTNLLKDTIWYLESINQKYSISKKYTISGILTVTILINKTLNH